MAAEAGTNDRRPIRHLLRRLLKAPAAFSILWPALLLIGGYVAWHRWGAEHVGSQYYGLDPALIEVTDPPEYIRAEITATVCEDAALHDLSLLDPQASAKVAAAFATHPWVRRVVSVRKLPGGGVDVHLDYRRPVAMVEVVIRSPHPDQGKPGFFQIDADGLLLPPSEFSQADIDRYLHIVVPGAYPTGGVGTPFGDLRVEAAARLAAVVASYRDQCQLVSIEVHGDPRLTPVPQFEITTRDGSRLFWGSAPGQETQGESTAAMKLKLLLSGVAAGTDLRAARKLGKISA